MIPTIEWDGKYVRMLDQRKIPWAIDWYTCRGYKDVIKAIKKMVIRGAPAIGVAAAMGLALGASGIRTGAYTRFLSRFKEMAKEMKEARPTAVNLQWAVDRMSHLVEDMSGIPVEEIKIALREESGNILQEDIATNRKMGDYGQTLLAESATVLTHCNAGSLATAGFGTALGVIRAAHEKGKRINVIADETRPWLQGLRLTAFELMEDGIPVTVICDNAAGQLMRQKKIDAVITGADRIAANGDVANKVGTYQVAVLAKTNAIPFYVAAPVSSIDASIDNGDLIPLEMRDPQEISRIGNSCFGPAGVDCLNFAFDITPSDYVSAIITEKGIVKPPFKAGIRSVLMNS